MEKSYRLDIQFRDGSSYALSLQVREDERVSTLLGKLKRVLEGDDLLVNLEGDLVVIPHDAVKLYRLSPAPPGLPDTTLSARELEPGRSNGSTPESSRPPPVAPRYT